MFKHFSWIDCAAEILSGCGIVALYGALYATIAAIVVQSVH